MHANTIYLRVNVRERPNTGVSDLATPRRGEDAAQVYSTEEVCRRVGN